MTLLAETLTNDLMFAFLMVVGVSAAWFLAIRTMRQMLRGRGPGRGRS